MKKVLLVINPVAGKQEAKKNLTEIIQTLYANGYMVSVCVTQKRGDATEMVATHGGDYDLIICSGGDGTMNETVTGIIKGDLEVPVGYLPSGSFNDFAEYHKLSKNVVVATQNVIHGQPHFVDVIDFGGRYSINAADCGAFTWIPYTTPQAIKNTLGGAAYFLEGIKDLSKIKSQHMRFLANGGVFEGDYIFGIICNATVAGGVLPKNSNIVNDNDGLFEVGMIRMPTSALEFQETVLALSEENLADPHITFFKTSELKIESDGNVEWSLDGEHFTTHPGDTIRTLQHRITLMC